jgi:hypothetical protein
LPDEVEVSVNARLTVGAEAAAAGFDLLVIVTETESARDASVNPVPRKVTTRVAAVVLSDSARVGAVAGAVAVAVRLLDITTACDGTELRTPRPKEATATSAMRLKFVFVDICFLSIVVTRTFLVAASR